MRVSLASGDEYLTKLNLEASSGNLPDYFNVDIPTMSKLADEGLILPLDEWIRKYPNIQKVIKQSDVEALKYKGKLMRSRQDTAPNYSTDRTQAVLSFERTG